MSLKRHFALITFYALLACLALYWLLFHAGTSIGGYWTTDYYHFNWNYWWVRHALTTPGLNVYETNFVLFPYTTNLAYHTLTLFWYPLWAVLEPFIGTLAAMDVITVVGMTLTGTVFFLLLRRESVPTGLALAGGVVLQLTPAMLLAAMLSTVNYTALFWLPLQLLIWGNIARNLGSRRKAILWVVAQGLALYGMMMTDYQYLIFLAFLIIPYAALTLFEAKSWAARIRLVALGLLAVALMAALLWFAGPLPYILKFDRSTLSPQPIQDAQSIPFPDGFFSRFSTYDRILTLGAFVLPVTLISLAVSVIVYLRKRKTPPPAPPQTWGGEKDKDFSPLSEGEGALLGIGISQADGQKPVPTDHHGTPFLASAASKSKDLPRRRETPGVRVDRRRWFWLGLTILPLVFMPGATITIDGQEISTPYVAFHNLFNGLFRSPGRFDSVFIIGALIFAGRTWGPLVAKRPRLRTGVAALLMLVVLAEVRLFDPMPIQLPAQPYDFYQAIGREQGDPYDKEVVVEVPVAGGSGEAWVGNFHDMETEFYGMTHGKRMLNGAIARAPLGNFWYWLYDDPMLAWLGQRRYLEPDRVEAQLRQRINNWPMGYIVIHQDAIGRSGPTNQEIIGYFNSLDDLLCPVWVERDAVVYRTSWHPDGCPPRTPPEVEPGVYQIDIGASGDERYIGWGWHWQEDISGITIRWSGEYPQTKIYADLPPGAYEVSISAQAYAQTRLLRLLVNDTPLAGQQEVTADALRTYTFQIPASAIGDGKHVTLTLDYDGAIAPADIGQGEDTRKLALMVDWIRFARQAG